MVFFLSIVKTIIGYFAFMFIGTNLLGMIMRGILPSYYKEDGKLFLIEDISSSKSIVMTLLFLAIAIAYLYLLYHFWNIGIFLAGLIMMLTNLPDLLFEMRTGEKINFKNMPKKPINNICSLLSWLSLPLIWYSLYYLK